MDRKIIKEQARALRQEKWGVLLLSDVLTIIVAAIPLIGLAAAPTISLGAYENFYNTLNKKPTGWQKLYGKFKDQFESSFLFGALSIAGVLVICIAAGLVIVFVNTILGAIIRGLAAFFICSLVIFLLVIVFLVFFLPILFLYRYIGFEYLLINPDMKGDEAVKKAITAIKGHEMESVGFFFSYILELLLTLITLGAYYVKLGPEIGMAYTIYADQIINGGRVGIEAAAQY